MKRIKVCAVCRHPWKREGLLPFDAHCDKCGNPLHVCKNCALHDPLASKGCRIQAAELGNPPTSKNFCEKFIFRETVDISTTEEKLDRKTAEQKWKDLFRD